MSSNLDLGQKVDKTPRRAVFKMRIWQIYSKKKKNPKKALFKLILFLLIRNKTDTSPFSRLQNALAALPESWVKHALRALNVMWFWFVCHIDSYITPFHQQKPWWSIWDHTFHFAQIKRWSAEGSLLKFALCHLAKIVFMWSSIQYFEITGTTAD